MTSEKAVSNEYLAKQIEVEKRACQEVSSEEAAAMQAAKDWASAEKEAIRKFKAQSSILEKMSHLEAAARSAALDCIAAEKAAAETATLHRSIAAHMSQIEFVAERSSVERAAAEKAAIEIAAAYSYSAEKVSLAQAAADKALREREVSEKAALEVAGNRDLTVVTSLSQADVGQTQLRERSRSRSVNRRWPCQMPPPPLRFLHRGMRTDGSNRTRTNKKLVLDEDSPLLRAREADNAARQAAQRR
jgi:hypothetical protein